MREGPGERGWDGDFELATALEAVLGDGPPLMLRPLPMDLDELAMTQEGYPVHGGGGSTCAPARCDLSPPSSTPRRVGEMYEDNDAVDRWLWVECTGSHEGYRDMARSIERLDDAAFAVRMGRAISGWGAFRRFKDRLSERPDMVAVWQCA